MPHTFRHYIKQFRAATGSELHYKYSSTIMPPLNTTIILPSLITRMYSTIRRKIISSVRLKALPIFSNSFARCIASLSFVSSTLMECLQNSVPCSSLLKQRHTFLLLSFFVHVLRLYSLPNSPQTRNVVCV